MRKSVFLLVAFISCNLIFTSTVMSEGYKVSDVSNISSSEVIANTEVENIQPEAVNENTTDKNEQPEAVTVKTATTQVQQTTAKPTSADLSKKLPVTALKAENVSNNVKRIETPKVNIETGTVKLSYKSENNARIKVLVEKDEVRYQYNLRNDGVNEFFPLQLGNGDYTISILENTEGSKYKYISTQDVTLNLENDKAVFLNSNQQINWDYKSKAALKALELTSDLNDAEAKINAIYEFVINNLGYNFDRYNNLPSTYLPDIDSILSEGKGICYDYSSLFAAMLRSVGIEAKLIKGYTVNVSGYHAWNEVYNAKTGNWMIIDTTYDSMMIENGDNVEMEKAADLYTKKYEF